MACLGRNRPALKLTNRRVAKKSKHNRPFKLDKLQNSARIFYHIHKLSYCSTIRCIHPWHNHPYLLVSSIINPMWKNLSNT